MASPQVVEAHLLEGRKTSAPDPLGQRARIQKVVAEVEDDTSAGAADRRHEAEASIDRFCADICGDAFPNEHGRLISFKTVRDKLFYKLCLEAAREIGGDVVHNLWNCDAAPLKQATFYLEECRQVDLKSLYVVLGDLRQPEGTSVEPCAHEHELSSPLRDGATHDVINVSGTQADAVTEEGQREETVGTLSCVVSSRSEDLRIGVLE